MEITGAGVDAVLFDLYQKIQTHGRSNNGSRGKNLELLGVTLRITKPRARISRSENRGKPFSAIGELLWYLSGSDKLEFIESYVGEYAKDAVEGVIEGAYGPRFRAMRGRIDQFASIEKLLTERSTSRRAVIQLFNAEDIESDYQEVPCTTTLQFHLREGVLHMSTTLRSNDAYWGLPHDVFCFTMIQEMMARRLKVDLGEYYQFVGSMHLYDKHHKGVQEYLREGYQQAAEMPKMPEGDPFLLVDQLIAVEDRIRRGEHVNASAEMSQVYWADIIRLLQVFWAREWAGSRYSECLATIREEVAPCYRPYIDGRASLGTRSGVYL